MRYSDLLLTTFEPLFASYWNNKWPKREVRYKIKDGSIWLMTDFLTQSVIDCSLQFKQEIIPIKETDDVETKMYKIEYWVKKYITYLSDKKSWNQPEYWQIPKETLMKRTGDCEDGAILIYSLAIFYNIPLYRIKLCAGYVKNPKTKELCGHAYTIFLRNDMTWCICDWCYYPTNSKIFNRSQHKELIYYDKIWWTSNHENSWAQQNVTLNFEGL